MTVPTLMSCGMLKTIGVERHAARPCLDGQLLGLRHLKHGLGQQAGHAKQLPAELVG